ncbi:hypothetical protein [Kitasatospora herbaricolor]|uniref:Uncharacterized protein n=1 Tax=Kitasatospora herbaricolor TaxID=68217 RepID=A0ABZ1W0H5_9ACTN|nr:hypothetical protein [Kitasatospora herbaricolor]
MNVTSQQAEAYLDAVDGALTFTGLRPEKFTVDDTDELADSSVTALPGAVLAWPAGHSKLDPERFPYGAVATWTTTHGWQAAAVRPDGTSDNPTLLPLTPLCDPHRVVEVIAQVLLGQAAPDAAEQEATEIRGDRRLRCDGGPAADPAVAVLRAEIWGHFHSHPMGRAHDGRFASALAFPVASDGDGWSQHGVQITYGDTVVFADLDGYNEFLELIAGHCPVIEGPLVLTL